MKIPAPVQAGQNRNVLQLERITLPEWTAFLLVLWPFLDALISSIPRMTSHVKFLADAVILCAVLLYVLRGKIAFPRKILPLVLCVGTFFCYTLIVYLIQYESILFYFWGLRNNFRFYAAFFIFIGAFREQSVKVLFRLLDVVFWINFALSLFQFVILGVGGDFLGGIFGIGGGFNGYTNIFLFVMVGKSFLRVFNNEESLYRCVIQCGASLLIAAMAEMKFFYVMFAAILVWALLVTGFTWKKFFLFFLGGIGLILSAELLVSWFGFENFLSLEKIIGKATRRHYATGKDVNRLSAIPILAKSVVTNPLDQIFGLGLGNCDSSSIAALNSPFFRRYEYLHYNWFGAPMMFIETGYIGLFMYLSFFVLCFIHAYKQMHLGKGNPMYCQLAMIVAVISCILVFYDVSMRSDAAYLMYFSMALPFIKRETAGAPHKQTGGDATL